MTEDTCSLYTANKVLDTIFCGQIESNHRMCHTTVFIGSKYDDVTVHRKHMCRLVI